MRSTPPRGEPTPSPADAPGADTAIGILAVGAAVAACVAVLAPPDPAAAQSPRAGDLPAEA